MHAAVVEAAKASRISVATDSQQEGESQHPDISAVWHNLAEYNAPQSRKCPSPCMDVHQEALCAACLSNFESCGHDGDRIGIFFKQIQICTGR